MYVSLDKVFHYFILRGESPISNSMLNLLRFVYSVVSWFKHLKGKDY